MAVNVLTASATLSSGSNWVRAEASSFLTSYGSKTDLTATPATQAVTFANAGNQVGIFLMLGESSTNGSTTLTISLQENTGSWTTRTTNNFTIDTSTDLDGTSGRYFALTTYAVDTTAGKWRYAVSANVNSRIAWHSSSGPVYIYAAVLDVSTAKPSSGDTVVLAQNTTLTQDENANFSLIVYGHGSTYTTGGSGAKTLTLTSAYPMLVSSTASFTIGSSGSAVAVANRFTLSLTDNTANGFLYQSPYAPSSIGFKLNLWGAEDSYIAETIPTAASSGQAVIATTRDLSAIWSIGDTVHLYGKRNKATDATTYTISNITASSITLNTNLNYNLYAGSRVVNENRKNNLGIWVLSTTTSYYRFFGYFPDCQMGECNVVGVYMENTGIVNFAPSSNATTTTIRSVLQKNTTIYPPFIAHLRTGGYATPPNLTLQNCHRIQIAQGGYSQVQAFHFGAANGLTIDNVTAKNCHYDGWNCTAYIDGTNVTINDAVFCHADRSTFSYGTNNILLLTNVINISISNSLFADAYASLIANGVSAFTMTNTKLENATAYNLYVYGSLNGTITGGSIGGTDAAAIVDLYARTGTYDQLLIDNCDIGSAPSNVTNTIAGSYFKYNLYDKTANDHRSWWTYGAIVSTGDGLTDTTVHTSGTGKFALRFEPTSSTSNLEWEFDVPTGNIQSKTMTVGVWCKINSATYYAGTHQLPRLTIDYDNGNTAYHQAGETTDWQLLFVTFTPTTTYGQITVTLSGRTDATTTNAYIYFDDFTVAYPPSVALDLGGMDNWANALPVTPPIALPISAGTVAQNVWQQLTTTSWGTDSMGEKLKTVDDKADIADAVWDEQTSDHTVAGSTGKAVSDGSKKIVVIDGGEVPIYES